MDGSLAAFLGVSLLVIVTPGPDTALTIRSALAGGRRAGIATALGVTAGQLVWALASSAGLVAILLTSGPLFQAVKLAGAAYLIALGAHSLFVALRPGGPGPAEAAGSGRARLRPVVAFRQGVVSNLGNPKMAAFFASLLPQFAPHGQGMLSGLLLLGLVFSTLTFAWLVLYATAVAAMGGVLRRPSIRRAMDGVAGLALIGLGARVAIERP
jgi:threonine/homoserine/homoserine lactone efflux protein